MHIDVEKRLVLSNLFGAGMCFLKWEALQRIIEEYFATAAAFTFDLSPEDAYLLYLMLMVGWLAGLENSTASSVCFIM